MSQTHSNGDTSVGTIPGTRGHAAGTPAEVMDFLTQNRGRSPEQVLGGSPDGGLMKGFIQAAILSVIALVGMTLLDFGWGKVKGSIFGNAPVAAPTKAEDAAKPTTATTAPATNATTGGNNTPTNTPTITPPKGSKGKTDPLDALGESGVKENPLDKKVTFDK